MSELNEEEQMMLDRLEHVHSRLCHDATPAEEADHIRITKMSGMVPFNVMAVYCDNHNSPHPDIPDFLK